MVYNPLDHTVKQDFTFNIYYTCLDSKAYVSENGGRFLRYPVKRNFDITTPVNVEAGGESWYIIK